MNNLNSFINLNRPILITGPTGTGKSKMAQIIFDRSSICKKQFLTLHLASIKEELIESELFGHKKGSFTGAVENKNGYLSDANDGTLFLDEIGELSLDAQKKLLYLLEEKKFTPVGDTKAQKFNGRLILATNRDLLSLVKENKFREDLYYRLVTFEIQLPAIKNDLNNLKLSIFQELNRANTEHQKKCKLNDELLNLMLNYPWPGNYRELKNTIDFMVVTSKNEELVFDKKPQNQSKTKNQLEELFLSNFHDSVELFESIYLQHVLTRNKGRVNDTARSIGLSKAALIYKSKKYAINTWKIKGKHYSVDNSLAA